MGWHPTRFTRRGLGELGLGFEFFAALLLLLRPWTSLADDPGRFLAVTEWTGTITHVLNETGSKTTGAGCAATWDAHHDASTSFTLTRDIGFGGIQFWKTDPTSLELTLTYTEDLSIDCGANGVTESTATADPNQTSGGCPPALNSFQLQINTNNNTYQVGIAACLPTAVSVTGCSGCPVHTGSDWWDGNPLGNLPLTFPLPPTNMTLSGTATFDLSGCASCLSYFGTTIGAVGSGALAGSVTVTWNLKPKGDVKLIISPLDYQDWLPRGNIQDPTKRGNYIQVKAQLLKSNGQPADVKAKKFTFKFTDVSAEPGICLNYPPAADADTDPDLRFEIDATLMPAATWTITPDGKQADTLDGAYSEITATVSAFDFGAYGDLTVTAEVDGDLLVGKLESDETKTTLLLPRRQEDSKIADAWKESPQGAVGLPDEDDSETDPVGDGHPGDGFTLYEEYRGFVVNKQHTRDSKTPPSAKKKDLFVRNEVPQARRGIRVFAGVSGLNVIDGLQADEFPTDRVMNFNNTGQPRHVTDQHGLLLQQGTQTGHSVALPEEHPPDTPKGTDTILMQTDLNPYTHLEGANGVIVNGTIDYYAAVVAHELAHGCAAWHHGETEDAVTWYVSSNGNQPELRETGGQGDLAVVVMTEKGADITSRFIALATGHALPIKLGTLSGRHSGDMNCLMRENDAMAYAARPATSPPTRYWVLTEVIGSTLCTVATGTGFNASSWSPQSRFGDCLPGRGKCKDQICVNDKYYGDAKHKH